MKQCFKCGGTKPLEDFYRHKMMADGHVNKCKECNKIDVKGNYQVKVLDPEWKESERKRGREKHRRLGYRGRARPESVKRWQEKFPEKRKATLSAQNLEKPFPGAERHHWSYNEEHFKDVIWLTKREHGKAHRFITYAQEHRMYRMKHTGELLDTKEKHEFYIRYCIKFYED